MPRNEYTLYKDQIVRVTLIANDKEVFVTCGIGESAVYSAILVDIEEPVLKLKQKDDKEVQQLLFGTEVIE